MHPKSLKGTVVKVTESHCQSSAKAIEARRDQRMSEPEYCLQFERMKSEFDGRFAELCHFAVVCALDQKKLAAEYQLLANELEVVKERAYVFSLEGNSNVTPGAKLKIADYLQEKGFDDPALKSFLAGAIASRKKIAASGGDKRSAKYEPVRKFLIEEYSKRTWKSLKEAQRALMPKVLEKAAEVNWHIAEESGEDTVYRWLRAHAENMRELAHA